MRLSKFMEIYMNYVEIKEIMHFIDKEVNKD